MDVENSSLKFQKTVFWSLAPAIVFIPIWIVFGRLLFGGPGGWFGLILMYTAAPVLFLYHLALFVVAFSKARKRYSNPFEYRLSKKASKIVAAYYICHIVLQLFMDDGGDQGNMGCVMKHWVGIHQCGPYFSIIAWVLLCLLLGLSVHICCFQTIEESRSEEQRMWELEERRRLFAEFA